MRVRDIIRAKGTEVETVRGDSMMPVALHKLTTLNIGALVVSPDGALVDGVLAERDVVRGLARHGSRLLELQVRDVMTRGTPTCSPDDPVTKVMVDMTRSRNRHVPVVEDHRLCGLVSIGDVVKSRLDDLELEAAVLRDNWIVRR